MTKTKQKILFFFLVIFSIYCALTIGKAWDEGFLVTQGKVTLNYLLSLGRIELIDLYQREYYSPIFYSLKFLFSQIFPIKYQIEISHIINLFFSLSAIIATKKFSKELFNENVGKYVFLILFFYPVFFGHMGFNSKDTILAFSHVWIFYLSIRYLKKQNIKDKANSYIAIISILAAVSAGINLFFLGTLIPIFLFVLLDIFFLKKFICPAFNLKKFLIDIVKGFIIFYFLLVLFWVDTHPNILLLPFNFFLEWIIGDVEKGAPYNLLNGEYFLYYDTPKSYLLVNLFYKSPEYFLFCYVIFLITFLNLNIFFKKKIQLFNYKLLLILSMIIFPFLIVWFLHFSLYDGLRHVLWILPYFCIIPALTIYYLVENFKSIKVKFTLSFLSLFIIYFFYNFFTLTPYQYTYLNLFSGKTENRYQKFENDYWGASTKELIEMIDLDKDRSIIFSFCGINHVVAKYYLKKRGYSNFKFDNEENAEYVIMTNRVTLNKKNIWKSENLINCYDKFKGNDSFKVSRNGVILSVVRKLD